MEILLKVGYVIFTTIVAVLFVAPAVFLLPLAIILRLSWGMAEAVIEKMDSIGDAIWDRAERKNNVYY